MVTHEKPSSAEQVACKVCLKEVPKSAAKVAEAADYVLYFCGLECFDKWNTGDEKSKQKGGTPAS